MILFAMPAVLAASIHRKMWTSLLHLSFDAKTPVFGICEEEFRSTFIWLTAGVMIWTTSPDRYSMP